MAHALTSRLICMAPGPCPLFPDSFSTNKQHQETSTSHAPDRLKVTLPEKAVAQPRDATNTTMRHMSAMCSDAPYLTTPIFFSKHTPPFVCARPLCGRCPACSPASPGCGLSLVDHKRLTWSRQTGEGVHTRGGRAWTALHSLSVFSSAPVSCVVWLGLPRPSGVLRGAVALLLPCSRTLGVHFPWWGPCDWSWVLGPGTWTWRAVPHGSPHCVVASALWGPCAPPPPLPRPYPRCHVDHCCIV